jgi:hypothetical protein
MPRKEFEAFTRLDASDVNTFLMDQTVMSFAGTAARGSAIPTPTLGMYTHLEDSPQRLEFYNGSAWVSPFGSTLISKTDFTAASSISIDDVFTSEFNNYEIILNQSALTGSGAYSLRLRSSGADNTNATYNYYAERPNSFDGGISTTFARTQTSAPIMAGGLGQQHCIRTTMANPNLSTLTLWNGIGVDNVGNPGYFGGTFTANTVFTGFTILTTATNVTGTIRVYGLRN